jgi:2-keto-4-pentenoate hydratase/2-oxohepta-3-ene-1,7-dioic acid hydratase in catechol pathway
MSTRPETSPAWQLVSVELDDGQRTAALLVDDTVVLPEQLRGYPGLIDVMRDWANLRDALRGLDLASAEQVPVRAILAPLTYPNKVLCSGPNFTDHLAEMGESGLGDAWVPYFFLKPPTTTLIADGASVLVSGDPAQQVDWEGELAAIVGIGGRDIPADGALDHVAGYAVANDISMRGAFRRDTPAAPFVWDWLAQKSADTSLPLGPGIVPSWLLGDVQNLSIRTRVNGVVKQDGSTADMVFSVADLISYASSQVTLEPGDVILTGTPAGVGAGRGEFLHPGDVVEVTIDGIGSLSNPVHSRGTR